MMFLPASEACFRPCRPSGLGRTAPTYTIKCLKARKNNIFRGVASRCDAADGPSRWGSDCAWCKGHGVPVQTLAPHA
eukprot:3746610-Karenia_brevis.AAC.1